MITDGSVVTDSVGFRQTLAEGTRGSTSDVRRARRRSGWSGATDDSEPVDAIILATGYRPSVGYLRELGALDEHGGPLHVGGISTTHVGLVYVGLEYQRSYASNTLRGVSEDARAVVEPLVAWIRDAPTKVGLAL